MSVREIPRPTSGGLILSYKCSAECRHCIYACSQRWNADCISEEDLEKILSQLSGKIVSSLYGPKPTSLDDATTKEKLRLLKKKGLRGIMISVNPFYLEYVPFEKTERAIRIALEVFGRNTMVYQLEYYTRFVQMGIKDKVPFEEYLKMEKREDLLRNVEFFVMGRAPYRLRDVLKEYCNQYPASHFFSQECMTPFLRAWHNHFDNYGNYIPGFCGGISFGDS